MNRVQHHYRSIQRGGARRTHAHTHTHKNMLKHSYIHNTPTMIRKDHIACIIYVLKVQNKWLWNTIIQHKCVFTKQKTSNEAWSKLFRIAFYMLHTFTFLQTIVYARMLFFLMHKLPYICQNMQQNMALNTVFNKGMPWPDLPDE